MILFVYSTHSPIDHASQPRADQSLAEVLKDDKLKLDLRRVNRLT